MTTGIRRLLPLLFVAFAAYPSAANAHVLDEYLQTTLVAIEPDGIRLQINLTPGIEVADKILPQVDRDLDGAISSDEADAYIDMLVKDFSVRLDGRDAELNLTASNIPATAELRTGHGIIQLEFSLPTETLTAGAHTLVFENRHFGAIGAYLFNAARPESDLIQIDKQNRNTNQSQGEIEFTYTPTSDARKLTGVTLVVAAALLVVTITCVWRIRKCWQEA